MGQQPSFLRREMLEIGGTMVAAAGCLGQLTDGATRQTEPQDFANEFTDADGFDGSVVKTDHLLTDSRNADVVIWKADDGTVIADGADQVVASGQEFSAVMQAAVDAGAAKIVIQDGHYVANSTIDLHSDTIVTGMGSDTTIEVGGNVGFRMQGQKGNSAALTATAGVDDQAISVEDITPFASDDLVLINTNRRTDYRDQRYGEIRRIDRVDDANNELILTSGGLLDTYRPENGAKAVALDAVSNVTIRDIELVGATQQVQSMGILAEYGENIHVDSIIVRGMGHSGVRFASTIYSAVDDCKLHDIAYAGGGLGYGVALSNAVRNIRVRNNVIHDVENHCTAVGGSGDDGFPRLLTFQNNEYFEDDADVHFGGVIQFKDNRFVHGHGGILTGADTTYINNCEFRNIENAAIRTRGDPSDLVVNNSQFREINGRAINLYDNPRGLRKLTLAGNDFTNITSNVLRFRTPRGFTCEFVGITENVIRDCDTNAFQIDELGDSAIQQTIFIGNHFENIAGWAVATADLAGPVRVMNNTLSDIGGPYGLIIGGNTALVTNNDINGYNERALLMECPGLVTGNGFSDGQNDAILVYETEDVYVTLNRFEATNQADVQTINATNTKVTLNDINTYIDVSGDTNHVESNFGYKTEASGIHTTSGSGGRSFTIPHDLAGSAEIANVWAESADAAGDFYVSAKDSNSITVSYQNAPPRGSNNLAWGYEVRTHTG